MATSSNNKLGKPRRISKKVFNKIKAALEAAYKKVEQLITLLVQLETIITDKKVLVQPEKKGDEPISKKLSTAEVNGYKLQRKQAKFDLKQAKKELKKAEDNYKKACKHNNACVAYQDSKFNSNLAAEHKARRKKDTCTNLVIEVVKGLQVNNDPRFVSLTDVLTDSRQFRKEMDDILKSEDNETYVTISGLSQVKTSVYKTVKDHLLMDNNSESDSAVTAG